MPTTAIRLVSSAWPPFAEEGDGPHVALDLVSGALQRAGYQASTSFVPEGTVTEAVKTGGFDGSPAMWRSLDREEFLLYSEPYLENRLMLLGRKGTDVSAMSLTELKGKKVGIVRGFAYGPTLEAAMAPTYVVGQNTEANLRALLRGELDYVLEDALVIHHLLKAHPKEAQEQLALGDTPLITRTLHLVIRKDFPDAEQVIARFNHELTAMLTDGSYHRALEVDWIRADVDHDGVPELVAAGDKLGKEPPRSSYQLLSIGTPVGTTTGPRDHDPTPARFVVRGVPYDSWSAVPDDYKAAQTDRLDAKPRTLRASIFEF